IKEALIDFVPESAFEAREGRSAEDVAGFKPPGEKVHSYEREGQHYEIWCASLADTKAKEILENMQVLVPMFIEGGSVLQLEQDWTTQRWKLFLLYQVKEKTTSGTPYSLVGYGTSYRVFAFPDRTKPSQPDLDAFSDPLENILNATDTTKSLTTTTPLDLPSRERLSQFLILPPYQGARHGQTLYTTMYTTLTKPSNILEFTVEDPNEAFDDLRDLCDLQYLRSHHPTFASLRINLDIPAETLKPSHHIPVHLIVPGDVRETLQRTTKIMPRQFDRLVEMHTLSFIPPLHRSRNRITRKEKSTNEWDRSFYFWRLYVKQRLYVFNRDQLVQAEREERVERLEAALDGVLEGYGKVLERVDAGAGEGEGVRPRVRKRKVVGDEDEDEDEEDGEEGGEGVVGNGSAKKVRRD
ncbi:histone acetyltransferase type B catalytic subunit, partial [Hortaea werneckii]